MAIISPKRAKDNEMENAPRSWIARPILSSEFKNDPPLEDVYVGLLKQKKDISTAIQSISSVFPGFHHLKRCSTSKLLLAPLRIPELLRSSVEPSEEDTLTEDKLKTVLKERGFDLALLEDDFQVVKVPARAARTKAQAERASKVWPMNFHPDPSIECLIDGSIFTPHQLTLIERYMNVAIEAARLGAIGDANCNGSALIADPEDGRILAIAASKIDEHPMWHAAMLAIDLVAKLQGGGAWELHKRRNNVTEAETSSITDTREEENCVTRERRLKRRYIENAPLFYPESLSNITLPKKETLKTTIVRKGRRNNGLKTVSTEKSDKFEATETEKCGPYLCTGYWTFLLREPCPLCAMALVHSRVSRIFYGTPNQNTGVLGSKTVLHAVPGLNHRYQVWSGIQEQECQQALQEIEHRNLD
ncbi:putative inactive tRNA-specific adenosine deaminase-like protein 3 [Calliopsis andreniformis]|uniref:putative inactive tRNA-specific adenosine deaminase-like protein 3 n=1 Tax=Calliopsis andreniformis TaxID=337506 RepID=UPI003FCD8BA6